MSPNTCGRETDHNVVPKSGILPLQLPLLDVLRLDYMEMGVDEQVVDLC